MWTVHGSWTMDCRLPSSHWLELFFNEEYNMLLCLFPNLSVIHVIQFVWVLPCENTQNTRCSNGTAIHGIVGIHAKSVSPLPYQALKNKERTRGRCCYDDQLIHLKNIVMLSFSVEASAGGGGKEGACMDALDSQQNWRPSTSTGQTWQFCRVGGEDSGKCEQWGIYLHEAAGDQPSEWNL